MSKSTLYTIVVALFVTTLLVSNIASTKLFAFFGTGLVWDGGAVLFPLSYVLGDAITEIYGFKKARKIIIVSLWMNVLMVAALWLVQILPPGVGWENQAAYEAVIGFVPRLVAGSLVAFLIGQIMNAYVFAKLKVSTKGRHLWARALGSSLVGNLLDTAIFTAVAFAGVIPFYQLVGLFTIAFVTKIIGEAVLMPVTYWTVSFMRKVTREDHYDRRLNWKDIFKKD